MPPTQPHPSPPIGTWVQAVVPIVVVLVLAVRPISNADFWWQLSRGRAVLEGQLSPSRFLLAGDSLAEADWLGGVPFYVVFALTGFFGLMLLKTTVITSVAVWCWRRASGVPKSLRLLLITSLAVSIADVCEPTSGMWDLLLLLISSATRFCSLDVNMATF